MRKFKKFWPVHYALRSLLIVAGVFLLTAALAPEANAQNVLLYFNFEDVGHPVPGTYDMEADVQPLFGGDNPGGGRQFAQLSDNFGTNKGSVLGTPTVNRTAGDIDNVQSALGLRTTVADNGHYIQINGAGGPPTGFNASTWSNMSLSFAVNTQGNGFNQAFLSYSITPGHAENTFVTFFTTGVIPTGGGFNAFTAPVSSAIDGQPDVVLRITFTGGTSNGNNLETVIDNIQLTGVPEPTTVAGGLLGVLGLCWHQRRRLRSILPRSRRT